MCQPSISGVLCNNHIAVSLSLSQCHSCEATDNVELLGVVIDNKLNFKNHISKLIKKVGRQIDVLNRFKHILSFSTKIPIYRAFIMPHFTHCSFVWRSCLKEDSDRLDRLH